MSKRTTELRKILGDVITLPPAEQKLGMAIKAKRFAEVLGRPVKESDMEAGGKKWPAARAAARMQFFALVQKSQMLQGITPIGAMAEEKMAARPLPPMAVVSMRPPAAQKYVPDENLFVTGDQPFELGKDVIDAFKEFAASVKEHEKKPNDKGAMQDAATSFAELGISLFDSIYGERDDQETDRPRPLEYEALVHAEVKDSQRKLIQKLDKAQLLILLNALNAETGQYNSLEDSFQELEAKAEADCMQTCTKWIGINQNKIPEDCRACALWLDAKAELEDLQRKGATAKKIEKAEEAVSDALSDVHGRLVKPLIDRFKFGLKKRLRQLYLKSEAAVAELEASEEAAFGAITAETETERKMRFAEAEAKEDKYRRAALMKRAKEMHKTWTDAEAATAVEAVLRAQAAQLLAEDVADPKNRAKAVKEADKQYKDAVNFLEGKKGAKMPKLGQEALGLAKLKTPVGDEDEDEEDEDEEYNPEESDDESDAESDDEEGSSAAGGGGSNRRRPPRTRPPKTNSGAGSFAANPPLAQVLAPGFFRVSLPPMARPPITPQNVAFRVGGARPFPPPPGYQQMLRHMQRMQLQGRRPPRVGGGCGCDAPPPQDDELPL